MTSYSEDRSVQQGLPIAVPVEPTGDPRVDAALERLLELDEVPVADQVEVFADIHQRLSAALGDTGAPQAAPPGGGDTP